MTSKELNLNLVSLLPEIGLLYEGVVSWQDGDDTGSHVVFEDAFVPYIIECVRLQNEQSLLKCFEVIERILLFNDEYAEEVIALSVLESLVFAENLETDLSEYMGKQTKKLFDTVRSGWSM